MTPARLVGLFVLCVPTLVHAQWAGFSDNSSQLQTDRFDFDGTSNPEAGDTNENYYDGDFGDIDGDGRVDRALISRYGLLLNTGGGVMTPLARGLNQYRFGDADGIGNDAVQLVDVDNDGDLDSVQGGNGELLTLQINRRGRFYIKWQKSSASALNIVNIDLERDGDVDLLVAHAYCGRPDNCGCGLPNCGGPVDFGLYVNDGQGNFTEESVARGLPFEAAEVVQPVAGDLDGDGDFDIVFSRGDTGQVVVAKNNGSGSFTTTNHALAPSPGGFTQGMHLADIDNDGDLDVMMANDFPSGAGTIAHKIYVNDGQGNLTDESSTRFVIGAATDLWGEHSEVLDVDYDGDLDFVTLRKVNGTGPKDVQIYLNDGQGIFTHTPARTVMLPGPTAEFGADLDVSDLDGDGTYDLWVGLAGEKVRPLINSYRRADGVAADLPRELAVLSAVAGGVTLSWKAPSFAATNRYYRVYRATAAEPGRGDRRLIKEVALSRHADEGFFAPITRFTTTAALGDPDVQLIGAQDEVRFIDRTAVPGVGYFYWVAHVGNEHTESAHAGPVAATIVAPGGTDTTAPELDILSPVGDEFSVYPRIAVMYADGQSGIDTASLRVSFSQPLGTGAGARPANADVSDLFLHKNGHVFVGGAPPPLALPASMLVTLTVSIADQAGNRATKTVQFVTGAAPAQLPTAAMTLTPSAGAAPLAMTCDATASADPDGKLVSWEWVFGDGSTANGRRIEKTWTDGGTYAVTLVVRDNEGGTAATSQTVAIGPGAGVDAGVTPDAGSTGDDGGTTPDAGTAAEGGAGGCCDSGQAGAPTASWLPLLIGALAFRSRGRRRRAKVSRL